MPIEWGSHLSGDSPALPSCVVVLLLHLYSPLCAVVLLFWSLIWRIPGLDLRWELFSPKWLVRICSNTNTWSGETVFDGGLAQNLCLYSMCKKKSPCNTCLAPTVCRYFKQSIWGEKHVIRWICSTRLFMSSIWNDNRECWHIMESSYVCFVCVFSIKLSDRFQTQ